MGLKKAVKQVLVKRQHHDYETALKEKNLSYSQWVEEQENKIKIELQFPGKSKKSLTNETIKEVFGGYKLENAGNHSKIDESCRESEECTFQMIFLGDIQKDGKLLLPELWADVVLIQMYEGNLSEIAIPLILDVFKQKLNVVLIYGDEDVIRDGVREDPWLKPDWSPDRFLSSFYFGGLVAVRTEALLQIWGKMHSRTLYSLLYQIASEYGGFAKRACKERASAGAYGFSGQKEHGIPGNGEKGLPVPVYHIRQVLFHSAKPGYGQIKDLALPEELSLPLAWEPENVLISIIIPSKDHPEILFRCLHSFLEKTISGFCCEVLVVDNGSSRENRQKVEKELAALNKICSGESSGLQVGFRYLYHPMEFNFSVMCNLGAEEAKGSFFLFLNDDMEIIQPDWLDKMAQKALLPYAGAVGAKLLYPDSAMIQHAGITNLRVGPAHKLQFLDDKEDHYFGMNRGVHNMLGVTGACLMIRRSVFEEAGGFWPGLAVAFNDVDLCYTIYEKGYYNIVRNDVALYHHESLSRGKDGESKEKQLRLLREKDLLYERHQGLYGKDPFYHPYLTTDMLESGYSPACHYQVTLDMPWAKVEDGQKDVAGAREDACLVVGMECAMDIYKWKYGVEPSKREKGNRPSRPASHDGLPKNMVREDIVGNNDNIMENGNAMENGNDMGYYFQGYSFVIGSDNACYEKRLLLKNLEGDKIYEISIDRRFRPDIKKNLADQLNVDLTGFAAKLKMGEIPSGNYQFGMLALDRCSRQRLMNWSSWTLEIK